jgi:peptidoglycan hydrolase-like protein with peptidoglycan-binding domain
MNKAIIAAAALAALCAPALAQGQGAQRAQPSLQAQSNNPGQPGHVTRQRRELAERQIPMVRLGPRRITRVQKALARMGFEVGRANGRWRPKWEAALKQFQSTHGLLATGMLNRETALALALTPSDFGMYGGIAGQTAGRTVPRANPLRAQPSGAVQ